MEDQIGDIELNLSKLFVTGLLDKFGAGNDVPGSGSAVAFQGMLASKLILTITSLTKDPKRVEKYSKFIPELVRIESEINKRVFPRLEELFYGDSEKFGEAIKARELRDKARKEGRERNLKKIRFYSKRAEENLIIASYFVIEISELSRELAGYAQYVFQNGFKTARGDSGAALSKSISAIQGSIAILELNILSFEELEIIEDYRLQADKLKAGYQKLHSDSVELLSTLRIEVESKYSIKLELKKILESIPDESKLSDSNIEATARHFQNALWKKHKDPDLLSELNPLKALEILGYAVFSKASLGTFSDYDGLVETAGIIDKKNRVVQISDRFPEQTKKFTLAHELGHALFHSGEILHRDRALDGRDLSTSRDFREWQADKFAANFLMPSKPVQKIFLELFGSNSLVINQETAFRFTGESTKNFMKRFTNRRSFSRFLACTTIYSGVSFVSLSDCFGVSKEAMAIRLEELNLFEY